MVVFHQQVHKHVHKVMSAISPHDSVDRFERLGVKIIPGQGAFRDKETLETPRHIIKAKRFVIASGSSPFVPPIEGLNDVPYHTNLGIIPGSFVYVSIGNAFKDLILTPNLTPKIVLEPKFMIALVGLGVLSLLLVLYKRFHNR